MKNKPTKKQSKFQVTKKKNPAYKVNKNALTQPKLKAIELWRETRGHISNICRALDISRTTFYKWMNEDEVFTEALAEAEAELLDDVRDALIQKIADGDMQAITFYLKKRHPDFIDQSNNSIVQNNFYQKYQKAKQGADEFFIDGIEFIRDEQLTALTQPSPYEKKSDTSQPPQQATQIQQSEENNHHTEPKLSIIEDPRLVKVKPRPQPQKPQPQPQPSNTLQSYPIPKEQYVNDEPKDKDPWSMGE